MNLNDAPQRLRWSLLLFLLGVAVLLTVLDSTGNLGSAFDFIRNPLAVVADWTAARSDALADALAGPRDLQTAHTEIDRLQARIDELERENEELREIQGEYQLLLDLFNRARQAPELQREMAAVTGSDTSLIFRSLIIDKGTAVGVRVGMPVEGARGLVGQVFRTTADSAQIALVTDSSSAIPVRLGSSRATGILRGGGIGGSMTIDWIDLKYQIGVNEVVFTSGLGGKFPENIVIGRVIEVERREAELFQRAVVQPAVDFESLEFVFVVTNFDPTATDIFTEDG